MRFFREKLSVWISGAALQLTIVFMGYACKVQEEYLWAVSVILWSLVLVNFLMEYVKRRSFYKDLFGKLAGLDQKYLITEMLESPGFLEAELFCAALYEIDKSMKERINEIEEVQREFKEYVELWIHEIKVPIATLSCMNYNGNIDLSKQSRQLDKLSYYVEQILFLSRADHSQKDYLMKPVVPEQVVNQVIRSNKELLLENKIRIEKDMLSEPVMTDAKWLEFMVGQIVNNSIKYLVCKYDGKNREEIPCIRFCQTACGGKMQLIIEDNGIGVCRQDLPRVFEKTFTGENGRKITGATGMGLYICKKLCDKLGHRIWMESEEGKYARIGLEFGTDEFYAVTK